MAREVRRVVILGGRLGGGVRELLGDLAEFHMLIWVLSTQMCSVCESPHLIQWKFTYVLCISLYK